MSASLPWLATDQGSVSSIALDLNAIRLIPASSDYSQIKGVVENVIIDLKAGRISGEQQVDLYARKFSPKVSVRQWHEILNFDKS